MAPSEPKRLLRWLGERSWLGVVRVGVAALGVGLTGWLLTSVWPEPDRVARSAPPSKNDPANLAPFPESPVTVLVVGLDSNRVGDSTNRAAPKGPANADALMLLRVAAAEPVQVLQIPTELGVQLPNRDAPTSLASLWPVGGVGLLRDVIREIIGLPQGVPQRYVVMSRAGLRKLVDGLGAVEVTLGQSYQRVDQSQDYTVNLQAGRQRLNGLQAEQLVRYRSKPENDVNRRERQQILLSALLDQLKAPTGVGTVSSLVKGLEPELETNLSRSEQLSLAAAVIASPTPAQMTNLPLADRAGNQNLRQIKPGASRPLWPRP